MEMTSGSLSGPAFSTGKDDPASESQGRWDRYRFVLKT